MSGLEVTPALTGQQAMDGPWVAKRADLPQYPRLAGQAEQEAINSIREALSLPPLSAIAMISNVRTINQNPAIAIYKTEVMEYLRGKL